MAVCLSAATPAAISAPEQVGASGSNAILVYSNGTVAGPAGAVAGVVDAAANPGSVHYSFGLPAKPPERRWREDDVLPIYQTSWEEHGIRYTQRVLVTSLGTNDLALTNAAAGEAVLLVQLVGQNTATEYTTARAAFEVKVAGRPLDLVLRGGLVYAAGGAEAVPLAALEIPSEGIAQTNGAQLRFQGHMPPGISGSMTVKIPATKLATPAGLDRLMDLNFEDEVRRLTRAWRNRSHVAPPNSPLRWAEPGK